MAVKKARRSLYQPEYSALNVVVPCLNMPNSVVTVAKSSKKLTKNIITYWKYNPLLSKKSMKLLLPLKTIYLLATRKHLSFQQSRLQKKHWLRPKDGQLLQRLAR